MFNNIQWEGVHRTPYTSKYVQKRIKQIEPTWENVIK